MDIEFVFALKLHISPDVLNKMFFYDIMLLYHKYEDYVKEENKSNQQQYEDYSQQQDDMKSEMNSMVNSMNNKFNIPNMGGLNMGNFNF